MDSKSEQADTKNSVVAFLVTRKTVQMFSCGRVTIMPYVLVRLSLTVTAWWRLTSKSLLSKNANNSF